MAEDVDRAKLLDSVEKEHARWEAVLEDVGRKRMTESGVVGSWSVKDLIAHVTWSENEMLKLLGERSLENASKLWELPVDERNRIIYEENRDRSLEEVMREADQVYHGVLEEIQALSEEDLHEPSHYEGMPSEWIPWQIIMGNTYKHYAEHTGDIANWLGEAKR
jgi:hypothetical protein